MIKQKDFNDEIPSPKRKSHYKKENYMKQYGLNSAEYIKCLFIDYLLSKDEDSIIGNEFMYGIKRKLVDLVVLKKHKTIAVEVKSNNDNLIRLEEQIKEYKKIFDYVLIVTTEKHKNNVIGTVSDDIGIYIVQDDSSIIKIRNPWKQKSKDKIELLYSVNTRYLCKVGNYSYGKYNADELRGLFVKKRISYIQEILFTYLYEKYNKKFNLFISERGVNTHIEDLCILSSSFQIE